MSELWQLALAARRDRADLFHAPHYVCPPWLPCPAVVTVHDLIHLRFPVRHRHPLAPLYARLMLRLAVRRARRLITVSESTRQDLVDAARAPAGADPRDPERRGRRPSARRGRPAAAAPTLDALGVSPPYFLFVGNPLPHKNLAGLLDAFAGLPPALGRLVLVGIPPAARGGRSTRLVRRARPRGPRAASWRRAGGDAGAPLPERAPLVVCPSLWEGFGLAGARGDGLRRARRRRDRGGSARGRRVTRACSSTRPALTRCVRRMYTLAGQEPLRAALRARGLARARAFSWRHVAEATVAVYREALGP